MFARRQSKRTRQPGPKGLFVSLSPTTSTAKSALLSGAACGAVRDACMASIVRPATQDRLFNTGASWASCAGAIVFYTAYTLSAVNQLGERCRNKGLSGWGVFVSGRHKSLPGSLGIRSVRGKQGGKHQLRQPGEKR